MRGLTEFGTLLADHPTRILAKAVLNGAPPEIAGPVRDILALATKACKKGSRIGYKGAHTMVVEALDSLAMSLDFHGEDAELEHMVRQAQAWHRAAAAGGPQRDPSAGPRSTRRRAPDPGHRPGRPDRQRRPRGPLDETAKAMQGLDLEEMYAYASSLLGESIEILKGKYGHLNPGLIRMNIGNRLRSIQSRNRCYV